MKKILNAITIALVMSACTLSVSAQTVVENSISTSNFAECKAHLDKNPSDTIRTSSPRKLELTAASDTIVTRNSGKTVITMKKGDKLYFAGIDVWKENDQILRGDHYVVVRLNVLPLKYVADSALVEKVDNAAIATQVALKTRDYGQKQDVNYYQASVYKKSDGKVVDKVSFKNGLRLNLGATYRSDFSGIHAFGGMIGAELTTDPGMVFVGEYRLTKSQYPANAENPNGSYFTHGLRAGAGWRWALDTYETLHIAAHVGAGLDYQSTKTAENQYGLLQSNVFTLYPWGRIRMDKEFFNSRWGVFVGIGAEAAQILTQNLSYESQLCLSFELGLRYNLGGSILKTVTK